MGEIQAMDGLTEHIWYVPDATVVVHLTEEIVHHADCTLGGKETP